MKPMKRYIAITEKNGMWSFKVHIERGSGKTKSITSAQGSVGWTGCDEKKAKAFVAQMFGVLPSEVVVADAG